MSLEKTKPWVLISAMLVIAILVLLLKYLSPTAPAADDHRLRITTSFYPLYFFTSRIAGDNANVYNITPSGAEPHDYEPTTQDIITINKSNLLILSGGKLEPWGDKIKDELLGQSTRVLTVGETLAKQQVTEASQTIPDPHVWLDPVLAEQEAQKIKQALIEIDPSHTAVYEANAANLSADLVNLDAAYRAGLKECPKKDIVTSHAAFGYLASEYGFNQIAISGLSPDAEPSARQFATVAALAKKNQIKYIFFESLVSPKLAETIAAEVGAKTLVLNPLEGLSSSDLSAGKTYLTEMQSNLANLRIALECP